MNRKERKASEAVVKANLLEDLASIARNGGAVHENKAREVFARALGYLINHQKERP